ncbi:MAG: RNA polymerase sigma factor [Muribaculaceae bacterium]
MTGSRHIDEQQIATLAAAGNADAMKQIYCFYAGELTATVARYVVDADAVRDVLHDSFVKIFSSIGNFSYRGEGSLKAWMKRIAVNEALARLKDENKLSTVSIDDSEIDIPDESPDVEHLDAATLMGLIKQLPTGCRTVLNLYALEHRSHSEIAALLGITPGTSASQLHRAKLLLAQMIRELN